MEDTQFFVDKMNENEWTMELLVKDYQLLSDMLWGPVHGKTRRLIGVIDAVCGAAAGAYALQFLYARTATRIKAAMRILGGAISVYLEGAGIDV
jgi:hypothetical protein